MDPKHGKNVPVVHGATFRQVTSNRNDVPELKAGFGCVLDTLEFNSVQTV